VNGNRCKCLFPLLTLWAAMSSHVAMARGRRQQTTMSLNWIAERLHSGSWTRVSKLLNEQATQAALQRVVTLCQW
jgi:hypothetical protein